MNLREVLLGKRRYEAGQSIGDMLKDNVVGADDGFNSLGEHLGKKINDTGASLGGIAKQLMTNPGATAGGMVQGVKGDLDNLMFEGGAMQRPEDVLGYAAAPMAPGGRSLMKNVPNRVNALNYKRGKNYHGGHTAPLRDGYSSSLDDLAGNIYPDDIYSAKAAQYYGTGDPKLDKRTALMMRKYKGKPDALVDIHRAVPKGQTDINAGDWITINKEYAKLHGDSWLDGDYDIVTEKVPSSELFTDGNSIHEFGWDPDMSKHVANPVADAKAAWDAKPNDDVLRKAYLAARKQRDAPALTPAQSQAKIRDFLDGLK